MHQSARNIILCALTTLIFGCQDATQVTNSPSLEQQVEGLWLYTGLVSSSGQEMPLDGIFLFKNGVFVQHAVFKGEPIEDQGSMAHYGPYSTADEWIHLIAEQTISTGPEGDSPFSNQGQTEHDLALSLSGDELALVFSKGTGTVQTFKYVGPGEGEIYPLNNGSLAFADDYFILVSADANGVEAGYGTFAKDGNDLTLNIILWTSANQSAATNMRDTIVRATFDGHSLGLEDGRSFAVVP